MKLRWTLFSAGTVMIFTLILLHGRISAADVPDSPADSNSPSAFLGKWDLTLHSGGHDYASWIDLNQRGTQLQATMVGRWGNARPLPRVAISGNRVTFVSPKEEEGSQADLIFQGTLAGEKLSGTVNGPDGRIWRWTGVRAPGLERSGSPAWGSPIRLFNGKNLDGWRMSTSGPPVWTVSDGTLVSPGHGPELITATTFGDFRLHMEFNAGPNANSGVYLRGRYEVQIETDSVSEPPSHHMGGVYGFLAPEPELPRTPDTWQTFDITLIGRRITVVQNGTTIIDDQEIPGITGGALNSQEGLPGPIYLQGSEEGQVRFRNLVITPSK